MSAFCSSTTKGVDFAEGSNKIGPGHYEDVDGCLTIAGRVCNTPERKVPFGGSARRFSYGATTPEEVGPGHYNHQDEVESPRMRPTRSPAFGIHEDRWSPVYKEQVHADAPGPCSYHRRRPSSVASACPSQTNVEGVGFGAGERRRGILGEIWESRRGTTGTIPERRPPLPQNRRLNENVRDALSRSRNDAESPEPRRSPLDNVGPGAYGARGVPDYERHSIRNQSSYEGFLVTTQRFVDRNAPSPGPGDYNRRTQHPSAADTPSPPVYEFGAPPGSPRSRSPMVLPARPMSVPPGFDIAGRSVPAGPVRTLCIRSQTPNEMQLSQGSPVSADGSPLERSVALRTPPEL